MAVTKAEKVPEKNITSVDVTGFSGGLFLLGDQNGKGNQIVESSNIEMSPDGFLQPRKSFQKWLPNTVGTAYQVFPAITSTGLKFFTADDGRLKWCEEGDTDWTNCGGADTAATLTTALTGTHNDLIFTAVQQGYESNLARGANGNSVRVRYVNPGTANAALSIVVTANTDITVNLATNGASAITTTSAQIKAAIDADATAKKLVTITNAASNDGTGVVIALAYTNLAGGVTGTNWVTTGNGVKTTFLRVLDSLLIMNGVDKLSYVGVETNTVVKYTFVANPTTAVTIAPTVLTNSGAYKIYYGYTFSSATGETKINTINTYTINKTRDNWKTDGTEYLTISRPAGNPAGATYWNLYIALASNGGTIQESDMLMLAGGLDLATVSVVDNGTLSIDIGRGNPPTDNSTDGPVVTYGIETNGRPVLFGDINNPHNVWIGGDGEYARDFSSANGGYRSEPSKGTNYYPASVIGFRNGQGIPSLTVLFSNTQGLSKQATLEQQTINYGNQSFVVWGVTEQNYGAAGVASSYGVVNYNGALLFPSVDGFMSMDTQPQLQNVLSSRRITADIDPYVKRIKVSALNEIIGAAWDNKVHWLVPAYGFNTPTQMLIYDLNNDGTFYTLDIAAQWIGTVSPPDSPAFMYVCQGNQILKLFESFGTVDFKSNGPETFSTHAKGTLLGFNEAYNGYYALVQAVFYVTGIVGPITLGVWYRNESGLLVNKEKLFEGPQYITSSSGGWSDPQYNYAHFPMLTGMGKVAHIDESASAIERVTKRIPVQISDLASEAQWYISTPNGYSDFQLRAISYEGENLGVKPDLR